MGTTPLPADAHVHTEWSWDAPGGSMLRSCARAAELGLPSISFTEHFDLTRWVIPDQTQEQMQRAPHLVGGDGRFNPPAFDVAGYLDELDRCRTRFPDLRIMTGVELGEPHWFDEEVSALLATDAFERVLGSLHSISHEGEHHIVDDLDAATNPADPEPEDVVRRYLAEALSMVQRCDRFSVLAHLDYPARGWPPRLGPFPIDRFEEELRAVLAALAASDRALEINTRLPMDPRLVDWWCQAGGKRVTFGSDAHEPGLVAHGFADAAAMAVQLGFTQVADDHAWRR
jgi:histidinol-phosphatase (PHP family)